MANRITHLAITDAAFHLCSLSISVPFFDSEREPAFPVGSLLVSLPQSSGESWPAGRLRRSE